VLALAGLALAAAAGVPAPAQSPQQRPTISIAASIAMEPASQTALPIRVGPAESIPRNSFVRVRGLPAMAALSEGHSIAPGAWAIPIAALPNLKITLPQGAAGRSDIAVMLVAIDGSVLAEAKATLVVAAAPAAGGRPPRDTAPPATATILRATPMPGAAEPSARTEDAPAGPTPMTPEDRERALRLMKKGDDQLQEGNVSAARLLYERANEAGLAEAAMALAATFDAAELARLNVRGVAADRNAARRWYERARQLGARDADQRLRRLGAN
jgi:hypothetical protein